MLCKNQMVESKSEKIKAFEDFLLFTYVVLLQKVAMENVKHLKNQELPEAEQNKSLLIHAESLVAQERDIDRASYNYKQKLMSYEREKVLFEK